MAYLVKSINLNNTGEDVVCNVRLFSNRKTAEKFLRIIAKQIPDESDSEWAEIEELPLFIGSNV
jgi:hypothetical protein